MRGGSVKSPYKKGHRTSKKQATRPQDVARQMARNVADYERQIECLGFIARYKSKPKY